MALGAPSSAFCCISGLGNGLVLSPVARRPRCIKDEADVGLVKRSSGADSCRLETLRRYYVAVIATLILDFDQRPEPLYDAKDVRPAPL